MKELVVQRGKAVKTVISDKPLSQDESIATCAK